MAFFKKTAEEFSHFVDAAQIQKNAKVKPGIGIPTSPGSHAMSAIPQSPSSPALGSTGRTDWHGYVPLALHKNTSWQGPANLMRSPKLSRSGDTSTSGLDEMLGYMRDVPAST